MKYITENALILIPVLYVIGMFLKALEFIKDKYIPCILLVIGIAFSIALIGFNVNAIIQGILVSGGSSGCGSAEGTPRSISHYNTIGTINSEKTDEELTQLTTI